MYELPAPSPQERAFSLIEHLEYRVYTLSQEVYTI